MTVLSQHSLTFPYQLIPNDIGHFQDIGLDSLAGMATLGVYEYFRRTAPAGQNNETIPNESGVDEGGQPKKAAPPAIPNLLSTPRLQESPWKDIYQSKYSRITSSVATFILLRGYGLTDRLAMLWEDVFYGLANNFPISIAMHRSLSVLFGHWSWIALGVTVLRLIPRPQNFFQKWFRQDFRKSQWVWWTIGGYYVTSWFFNVADVCSQWVLPIALLEESQESVVSQLVNPEHNDWVSSLVGYVAPCVTAPWWEEVLYRGFLLPALILLFRYRLAVFLNGVIFASHHLSLTAAIPLAIMGWTWSVIYAKSGNLLTTMLIHAMWNSRIFLETWLGL